MSGFIYIWRDRKHKRYYIGCHWGAKDDGYVCSSSWMKVSRSHRPADFKRRILRTGIADRCELYIEEARWLAMMKPSEMKPLNPHPKYYNLSRVNKRPWHSNLDMILTVGQKISLAKKGRPTGPRAPEVGEAIAAAKIASFEARRSAGGSAFSDEHRRKISEGRSGIPRSPEASRRAAETLRRNLESGATVLPPRGPLSAEHKARIGIAHKGTKRTEATRTNIAAASSKAYLIEYSDGRPPEVISGLKAYGAARGIPYVTLFKAAQQGTPVPKYGIAAAALVRPAERLS